jgi:hypothetical protein
MLLSGLPFPYLSFYQCNLDKGEEEGNKMVIMINDFEQAALGGINS